MHQLRRNTCRDKSSILDYAWLVVRDPRYVKDHTKKRGQSLRWRYRRKGVGDGEPKQSSRCKLRDIETSDGRKVCARLNYAILVRVQTLRRWFAWCQVHLRDWLNRCWQDNTAKHSPQLLSWCLAKWSSQVSPYKRGLCILKKRWVRHRRCDDVPHRAHS